MDRVDRRTASRATSTASPPAPAARTRTASAPASPRRSATTSRRTTSRPRGVTLAAEDIREGIVGVLSVFVAEPQFQGQTKDRLNNPEVQSVGRRRRPARARAVAQHQPHRRRDRSSTASSSPPARARRSRAAQRRVIAQDRDQRPARLCPASWPTARAATATRPSCSSSKATPPAARAKQGRDRNTQAVLPLRGKVLNTEGTSSRKVLENKELADLVTALGCGVGQRLATSASCAISASILLADADPTATTSRRCC